MIEKARQVAIQAHGDQKYGSQPYFVHLDDVVNILREYGVTDEVTLISGYLHDTLEDTKLSVAQIDDLFGEIVAETVAFCTDEEGPNRKSRKQATYDRIRRFINVEPLRNVIRGVLVKVADRLANVRASRDSNPGLLSMYRKERHAFKDALSIPQSHEQLDRMWIEYENLLKD